MSYLDKLSIQGIRSFDSNQSQVVQFYPLTIILGPNGAGKTSIIEALKYVTTGLTPPNSGSGKTFVLDPNVANSPTVRAQVKLKFTDIERKTTVITRSIETNLRKSKTKTQMSFKALNSVIRRDDKTIDSRCTDINNEMLILLGVSKAVLNNVIFCHQEECNWPLSESKVLKEKFDDIFGSMGYVKALDKIKKLRQLESQRQKLLEKDVKLCKFVKEESDGIKKYLKENQQKLDKLKEEFNENDLKLSSIKSELNVILSKEETIQSISNEIVSIQASIKEKEKSLENLNKNVKTLFAGNESELKSEILNFETNAQNAKQNKSSLMTKGSELSQKYSKLNELQQNLSKELTKLQYAEDIYKTKLNDRNKMVLNMSNESIVSIDDIIIGKIKSQQLLEKNDISIVIKLLNNELIEMNKELDNQKSVGQQSCQLLAKQLSEFNSTKSKFEHEVQLWEAEQHNKQKSLTDFQRKLKSFSTSDSVYDSLNENIKRLNEEIKQMESFDIESKKKANEEKINEKKSLKNEINLLEEKLSSLQKQNEEKIKLEILKKEKTERQLKANQISEIHCDVMQTVSASEGQFHSLLNNHIFSLNSQLDRKLFEITKKEKDLSSNETRLEIKNNEIRKKRRELKELELKVKKVCKLEDYENTLKDIENELKELRARESEIGNYEPFIKSQIHCIENTNSCPVCERDVTLEWEAKSGNKLNKEELLLKLDRVVSQTPDTIEELKNKIKSKQKEFNTLIGLRSDVQTIRSLNSEIPKIETEINKNSDQNTEQKTFIDNEKMKVNKQKSEINSLRDVLQDAKDYDNCWTKMRELDKNINSIDLSSDFENESIDDLTNDLQLKRVKYEDLENVINKNQKTIVEHSDSYHKKQNALQTSERKKLEIEKHEHQKIEFKKKITELEEEIKVLDQNIIDSQIKAMELNPKIEEIETNINDKKNELKEFEQKIHLKVNRINYKLKDIERLNKEIEDYQKSGKSEEIIKCNTKLSDVKNDLSDVDNERQRVNADISKLAEEISNFEIRKRELNDNLKIKEIEKEINEKNGELSKHKEALGFSNLNELKFKKRELEKQEKKLEGNCQQLRGRQTPVIENITKSEKDLNNDRYRNADKEYKQKSIDLAISEISGEDLNKYYKALDFAVSDFHRKKIEEINKLIKGFWRQAYRGVDIDYIKIVSDEVERSANDKRRTFNYRVVMVKENSEMDMRGRCSAGQKVLASLIIRLALAEIFCSNCSVLALDEPTTNLDKDNITSFATAITEIVKYRNKWKNSNFQLIIITHDEEFLRCLDSETGQYYYKVFKNNSGFSTILRKSISNDNYEQNE